jgi:hypothetical protein
LTLDSVEFGTILNQWYLNPRPVGYAARQTFHIACGISAEPEKINIHKKFWEELIVCFHFTVILISDTSRKLSYVCVIKSIRQYNLGG